MHKPLSRFLFWAPRILGIAFAVFISLFALDVFEEGFSFWSAILALLIHLIPTAMVIFVLILSWRWEWVGGVLFTGLGFLYLITAWGKFRWSEYLTISGPLFLIGFLFFLNFLYKNKFVKRSSNPKSF